MPVRVKRDYSRETWDEYYRRYQNTLATEFLIPTLAKWGVDLRGKSLLEVGGGDGGCGAAFFRAGCRVVMLELNARLVDLARMFNEREGLAIKTVLGDVFDEKNEAYAEGPFDIVLFRDVMEHLESPARALQIVKRHVTSSGIVFVVFPPYYSPYGAHQQILPKNASGPFSYNKLPYVQLLPDRWFNALTRGEGEAHAEVRRLRGIRLTIRKFERSVADGGFSIRKKRFYLSRPSFALRYGIPVVEATFLGRLPLARELLVTAAHYLLEPDR